MAINLFPVLLVGRAAHAGRNIQDGRAVRQVRVLHLFDLSGDLLHEFELFLHLYGVVIALLPALYGSGDGIGQGIVVLRHGYSLWA